MVTTDIDERAEVFSRPAARFDEDGQLGDTGLVGPGLPTRIVVRGYRIRTDESPQRGLADGDGGGQRPRTRRPAGDGAGWLAGRLPPTPSNPRHRCPCGSGPNLLVTGHPDATGADAPPPG